MTNEEKAQELCEKHRRYNPPCSSLECYLSALEMAKWKEQKMIEKSCAAFCKVCDTKECEDYESDTCNWLKKFKQAMKGE